MTRTFKDNIHCPHCGRLHTAESALERWIRNNPELDSRNAGIVRFDLDILLHRYLTFTDKKGTRDIQALMFIEAKAFGADLNVYQQDTLSMFNQVLRNRRRNIHNGRRGRHAASHTPLAEVYSHVCDRGVRLRMFGGHLLQMSGVDPVSSDWMKWDYKPVTLEQLVKLLRFELDPDIYPFKAMDWRRRYSAFQPQPSLFDEQA